MFCVGYGLFLWERCASSYTFERGAAISDEIPKLPASACQVGLGGVFKFEDTTLNDAGTVFLYAKIMIDNKTDLLFRPGGKFKLGLRWSGVSARTDQYRIELPNEVAPGEQLYFTTRVPLKMWNNLNDVLIIEFMSENEFWCSDYGGMRIFLSKNVNHEIGMRQSSK